jgi:hypothetical protein
VTELEYAIKHGGLTPKRLLKSITRRDFGMTVLGGLAGTAASRLINIPSAAAAANDFTIAIIPDPQYLAGSCPDGSGQYYTAMMQWIIDNKNILLKSGKSPFAANIKAVIGVGDCVDAPVDNQFKNAEAAWRVLDANGIAFTTPPGNHDYSNYTTGITTRDGLGDQFRKGYFSAKSRSRVYASGIDLGDEDMAYWVGSHNSTGANTAVKFVISGTRMLVLAMDFFAGSDAWSWAYDVVMKNQDCECYITTHAWLTAHGSQYRTTSDAYGPDFYKMAAAPYSNSAVEAWNTIGVNTWQNLCGIFCGHDFLDYTKLDPNAPTSSWFWQQVPIQSSSKRQQTVQQLFVNAQRIDSVCAQSVSPATGAGQIASVFLLSRRPALGVLEGRMISTQTGNWFEARSPKYPAGTSWSDSETLLFSVPFTGLK